MSLSSLSARRQIWSNQHPLRRQRSLFDSGLTSYSIGGLGRSDRGKYEGKQFSVDHVYAKGIRSAGFNLTSDNKQSTVIKSSSNSTTQWSVDSSSSEFSVSGISTARKKYQVRGYGETKKDQIPSDCLRKTKGNKDRVNLNIFLGHTASIDGHDGTLSSLESLNEIGGNEISGKNSPENFSSPVLVKPNIVLPKRSPSGSIRKGPLPGSKGFDQPDTIGSSAFLRALPSSLTIERRPPLVRAMSAPVRTLDENSKNIIGNKRKSRRRKLLTRNPSCDKSTIIEATFEENDENNIEKARGKNGKKSIGRPKSALGCDIVTLVSLISSEGSDSEKEDSLIPAIEVPAIRRAPLLRKTGKSVSFQENEPTNYSSQNKEFPQALRRGSIAPLAAKIRANRPPTAPPVSIFAHNTDNSDAKMSENSKNSENNENDSLANAPGKSDNKENDCDGRKDAEENNQFPEHVKSMKERECWKLFQKMLTKGVTVSYDTVLRGMLTPTELRLLQKQRDLDESKKRAEAEKAAEAAANENPNA